MKIHRPTIIMSCGILMAILSSVQLFVTWRRGEPISYIPVFLILCGVGMAISEGKNVLTSRRRE